VRPRGEIPAQRSKAVHVALLPIIGRCLPAGRIALQDCVKVGKPKRAWLPRCSWTCVTERSHPGGLALSGRRRRHRVTDASRALGASTATAMVEGDAQNPCSKVCDPLINPNTF
jgi:hypothetical protein